jgi:hypothetical protein
MADWKNISDEEFDDVFRKQTENHEEVLWPDAWNKMSEKLDKKDNKRRFIIWWRYAAVLVGGLLIGLMFYNRVNKTSTLTDNPTEIPKIKNIDTIKTNKYPKINSNKPPLAKGQEQTIENKTDLNQSQKAIKKENTSSTLFNRSQKQFLTNNKINKNKKENLPKNTKKKQKEENKKGLDKTLNQVSPQIAKTSLPEENNQTQIPNEQVVKTTESNPSDVLKEQISGDQVTKTDDLKTTDSQTIAESTQSNIKESENQSVEQISDNQKIDVLSKFSFLIGASPDYSTISFNEMKPMGYNLRLGFQYSLLKKLKLEAGIIRSLKLYDAYPENYTWPANWGMPSSPLREVSASCSMLDIPIGLKYEFRQKKKSTLFVAMGITNYYMMNEKYNYYYENDADPNIKMRKWEGSTGFAGAGVINLSIGIQKEISKNFKIQLEPFIKAPIRNIGLGNVRLFSSGIFLNVIPQNFFKKSNR